MNIPQQIKERILSGDLKELRRVLDQEHKKNLENLIYSTKGEIIDNQLKGKCQVLAQIINLLP